ncbi:MAG: hypothetical protein OEY94_08485 [Alphaproteobacteria bacterium]|nr:hypothetical protein [Alphaproteobacteria bacterium]
MSTRLTQAQKKNMAQYKTRPAKLTLLTLSCVGLSGCVETLHDLKTPEWLKAPSILYEDATTYNDNSNANAKNISSEDLLDADGEWTIVEESEGYDPSKAHLQAREKVDPRRRKKMKELAPHFEPNAESGEDHNQRILLVDNHEKQAMPDEDTDSGFLSSLKGLFAAPDSSEKGNPAPKEKPAILVNTDYMSSEGKDGIIRPPPLPAAKYKPFQKISTHDDETSIDTNVLDAVVSGKEKHETISWNALKTSPAQKTTATSQTLKTVKQKIDSKAQSIPKAKTTHQAQATQEIKSVFNIRNSRQPGKTRLVLDISGYAEFKTKIDPIRNVLRVRIYNTHWNTEPQGKFVKNSLLGSYVARSDDSDNSVLLEIRLRRASEILGSSILLPSTTKYHRIMIDLKE